MCSLDAQIAIGAPNFPDPELREEDEGGSIDVGQLVSAQSFELRVNYRMLYFFHGKVAAVVSQGLVKEKRVPPKEIDEAVRRKKKFEANPDRFTYKE